MDRTAITELADYTAWAWERIARIIGGLAPDQYATAPPGATWAVADCVGHILSGYDDWLRSPRTFALGDEARLRLPGGASWTEARATHARCLDTVRAALSLPDATFYEKRVLDVGGGPLAPRSLADVTTDLLLHERGHYGDLTTLFSHLGVKPYFNDYIIFATEPNAWYLDDDG